MTDATIDVVIPVWNRPEETRNCLVNLINNTPVARFIMVDSGSERDTERLLQEFADGLDDRALLMRDDANIGFVRAANRGFRRSEAPYLALVRNTTQVRAGWLEPLLAFASAHPEAGILLPCLSTGENGCRGALEVASASFAAMVITRGLYQEIGGFDEGMDGGIWCLRDYTRRACSKGFLSYRVPGPAVGYQEEVQFGSERRREENLQRTLELFKGRWGDGKSYAIHVPKGADLNLLKQKLDWLLKGARHGDSYSVMMPALLCREAQQAGYDLLHENIALLPLPRLAVDAGRRRVFERVVARNPGTVAVAAIDGIAFPWSQSYLSFSELSERIRLGYPE
ncbi:MAG: glycosyl transferase [Geobacteraceae bacterium GWC2_58_44]|nr:MAG: glycosyl transferase [Geobacteraceae bacterium GWC2_58_44]HBG07610.1 glycosyl transferase [Geobacter sp.]